MATHGSGCRWQEKGFSVYMKDTRKEPDKCLRCKASKRKCKVCKDYSEFIDRGFYLVEKRFKKCK